MGPMRMREHWFNQVGQPRIELPPDYHIVDDDLEWPGCGQSHGALDQHRHQNHGEAATVRPKEFPDEDHHALALFVTLQLRGLDHCEYPLLHGCERDTTLNG